MWLCWLPLWVLVIIIGSDCVNLWFLIAGCGVCHSDLHVMKGEIPFSSPCVVGHEITGEVVEHGALTDARTIERWKVFYTIIKELSNYHIFLWDYVTMSLQSMKKWLFLMTTKKRMTKRLFRVHFRLPVGSRVVGAFIMPCGNCSYCSKVTLHYTLYSICQLNYDSWLMLSKNGVQGHDDLCEDFFAYNRAKGTLYDGETRLFLRSSG